MSIFDWKIDTPIDDIIGEAVGAASMCWETPEGAGVFDSERASVIVDEVMAALRQKLWVQEDESIPRRGHAAPCEPGSWGSWG